MLSVHTYPLLLPVMFSHFMRISKMPTTESAHQSCEVIVCYFRIYSANVFPALRFSFFFSFFFRKAKPQVSVNFFFFCKIKDIFSKFAKLILFCSSFVKMLNHHKFVSFLTKRTQNMQNMVSIFCFTGRT